MRRVEGEWPEVVIPYRVRSNPNSSEMSKNYQKTAIICFSDWMIATTSEG